MLQGNILSVIGRLGTNQWPGNSQMIKTYIKIRYDRTLLILKERLSFLLNGQKGDLQGPQGLKSHLKNNKYISIQL